MSDKNAVRSLKLGMNFMTARGALQRDLLFKFAVDAGHTCFRCGEQLERENFSIDHKSNWSEAEDPKKAYFDLDNIAFSHHRCNAKHTSRLKYTTPEEQRAGRLVSQRASRQRNYTPEARSVRYLRTGN